jgi:transposase InsO family protein
MPWSECDRMSLREEFVILASRGGTNVSEVCRRYGVSRKTGYKWLRRYESEGRGGLVDRSREPVSKPKQTASEMEQRIVEVRTENPTWGGRKIRRVLLDRGVSGVPVASTIVEILRRRGLIDAEASLQSKPVTRFEHAEPNELWQMDFKGHFALLKGGRCHPLTVLDDHSRFVLALRACGNERGETVRQELIVVFRRYGVPRAMVMDNGSPWGSDQQHQHTPLGAWLMEQGIRVTHGRPYHPQTQGKAERFHRTLNAELLRGREFANLPETQLRFDPWREKYNNERPHEALDLAVPSSRYRVSVRSFVETPEAWDYGPGAVTRSVQNRGLISFRGREFGVGKAFHGRRVGLRPLDADGVYGVYFCRTCIRKIDLKDE